MEMTFSVNDSPFAGREGRFVTSRHLRDRLMRELLKDVSFRVLPLDAAEVRAMIQETKGYKLLAGARGQGRHAVATGERAGDARSPALAGRRPPPRPRPHLRA